MSDEKYRTHVPYPYPSVGVSNMGIWFIQKSQCNIEKIYEIWYPNLVTVALLDDEKKKHRICWEREAWKSLVNSTLKSLIKFIKCSPIYSKYSPKQI